MSKNISHIRISFTLVFAALIAATCPIYAANGDAGAGGKEEWVVAKKAEGAAYDFTSYSIDEDVKISFGGETFKLQIAALRKDEEVWLPLDTLTQDLAFMLLKTSESGFIIIRSDGTPLELAVGDTVVKVNKVPFLTLSHPPATYSGAFVLTADSLANILDLSYAYDRSANIIKLSKKEMAEFSTFTIQKPEVPVEERLKPPEVKPLPPPDIREELLPSEYQRDVDLKANATFSYLEEKHAHDRTRQSDIYLSGRVYDYTVDGRLRMRDIRSTDKQRFKEDGEHISIYGNNMQLKFLDNYLTMPNLRSQSQSYFGAEATHLLDPFKTTFIIGETDNTVSGPADIGAVRYYGDMYVLRQEYTDINGLFKTSGMILWHETKAETQGKSSTTTYPRRNFLSLTDTTVYLYPNLNLYYTHALSNYVPDNKVNARFIDDNWKVGISLNEALYSFRTSYERVGEQYASVSVPSTYQDFEGLDFTTNFKFTKNWYSSLGGRLNNNNVEQNPKETTTFDRSLYASTGFLLPWQQNVSLSHSVTETTTEGETQDLSGSRYKDYRIDYSKIWGNLTVQASYDHYLLDPFGTSTGGQFTDTYSGTLFQFFPTLNHSYIRLYQDMRKTKTFTASSYTTTYWNTDIGARWNFTDYLSASGDIRVATTEREAFKDTAFATLRLGSEFRSSPVTTWNVDYTLSNYDLYNPENQTTKHYTILFKVRHVFDINTPDKWGTVTALVYRDLNSNGKYDKGEPLLPNIRVNVVNGRDAYTDKRGIAVIKKVVPGNKMIKVDLSSLPLEMAVRGPTSLQSVIVKPLKKSSVEFPIVVTGKIKGRLYIDINKDGVYDKSVDEPLQNVRVYLTPIDKDTLTFSDGSYYFDYIYPGELEVAVDLTTVSTDYKLISREKVKVSLREGETQDNTDFLFSSKPIDIEYFGKI